MRRNHGHIYWLLSCMLIMCVPIYSQIKQRLPSIAVIDTDALYIEASGIKELADGLRPLAEEIKPLNEDLKAHFEKYKDLIKRIKDIPPGACPAPEIIEAVRNEEVVIRGKEAKAKEFYERRRNELIKPIALKIAKSLGEFAASKGYALVLDKSQLASGAIIIEDTDNHLTDVTTDFIKFFNEKYPTPQH